LKKALQCSDKEDGVEVITKKLLVNVNDLKRMCDKIIW
jgi:hypothetical protein